MRLPIFRKRNNMIPQAEKTTDAAIQLPTVALSPHGEQDYYAIAEP